MLAKVESEELRNCRRLLDYIDGENGFQKRLAQGLVQWSSVDCGTHKCLMGWFCADVLHTDDYNWEKYFGISINDHEEAGQSSFGRIFGPYGAGGDIHARRAALVAHIEHLEAKEKVAA